jgi:hypothetical protein
VNDIKTKKMKRIILVLAICLSTITGAQTTLVENQINFEQVKVLKERSEAKELNKEGITQYTASNKIVLKIDDKLRINRPEGGSKIFVSIQNKPTVMNMLSSSSFNANVDTSMSNTEITIKSLYVNGTRKLGYRMMAELATCGTCNNLLVDVELAMVSKEIRTNGVTREEAITKLKESKDLLDLGIVNQEDYDKLKAELTPIIINQ